MEIESILHSLDTTGNLGHTLTTEESLVLYNSLLILQNENHFRKIFFWGRIAGVEKDYYIAYGYVKDALMGNVFYYSINCRDWGLLPKPNTEIKLLTPLCQTRFQGDPALMTDILIEKEEPDLPDNLKKLHVRSLKEEDRLVAIIEQINEEALIVPRGALFKRPDGVVMENLSFEGLNDLEARELKSYLHFRKSLNKWNENLLTRNDYNYAIDFLDCISNDAPLGCWSLQLVTGGTYAIIKSLYWPGYIFYHRVGKPDYGSCYFGNGCRNIDVPFLYLEN